MRLAAMLLLTVMGMAGCASYQPSEANCFDAVARSNFNMIVVPAGEADPRLVISTKSVPCVFTALGGPDG